MGCTAVRSVIERADILCQVSEGEKHPTPKDAILAGTGLPIVAAVIFYIMGDTPSELAFWISMIAGWVVTVII